MNDIMKYVIANLKMNLITAKECDEYLDAFEIEWNKQKLGGEVQLIVCPSMFFWERFEKRLPEGVLLGAQNVFWEKRGSFTGEISPVSLSDAGANAVLCGHSERRAFLHETDEDITRKVKAVVESNMKAIVCVGETEEEKENGETIAAIATQLTEYLKDISDDDMRRIMVAYEPRWAIGTGKTPTADESMQARIVIRKILTEKYGAETAGGVTVLYGGSVQAPLVKTVCVDAGMDGVLVGRESLNPKELFAIVNAIV